MKYYEVLPRDPGYQPDKALTYSSKELLVVGQIVLIELKHKQVLGIVVNKVAQPTFKVKEIVDVFANLPVLPTTSIKLLRWLHSYYPGPMGAVVQQLIPKNIMRVEDSSETEVAKLKVKDLPDLTPEQSAVLGAIGKSGPYLLHGDTGSGKTRVYIELALRSLNDNKSALILTPEISLTSQLAADFRKVFGERVLVIHSMLTPKERYSSWIKILYSKDPLVVLGPRSALFSPFSSLGLVVVDEAHEDAFKQEQTPHYSAVRVASSLATIHNAVFLIGSGTPSINDYFLAQEKKIPILRMRKLAIDQKDSETTVALVDLTDHSERTRHPYLSNSLLQAIEKTLNSKEQVLLFLNRRGTARVIFCENCGWRAVCPRCDIPLIYHGDSHTMQCHTCGFTQAVITTCPVCHQEEIVFKGMGTKAIADAIQKLYPQATVKRFDTDNKKADRFDQQYESVKAGDVDILIGTQTLVKGLDLPKLGLIGVIVAETGLFFPDFTASERTYQLLSQVIGRVGRGHRSGRAIVQTYDPTNPVILSAIKRDWGAFYKTELAERQRFVFPPFCYLLKLTCRRASQKSAITATNKFAELITKYGLKIQILGPAPSFYEKVRGKYQWQVVVKARDRRELLKVIEHLPSGWSYDIDPVNLL